MLSEDVMAAHCVRVPKIFDWVNRTTLIKLKEDIQLDQKKETDFLCCDFHVPCGLEERTTLWTSFGVEHIGGSICIEFKQGCGLPLQVFINGNKAASVEEGSSFSGSFSRLRSVEVRCEGEKAADLFCVGTFKINLHFDPEGHCKLRSFRDIGATKCFLSDCHGHPVSLQNRCVLTCKELTSPEDRTEVHTVTPEGKKVTLQRVDLLKQGFVTVQFFNRKRQLCLQCVFPFSEVETILLCAPPGTEIDCEITAADCKAYPLPPIDKCSLCLDVAISLLICQSIVSIADVKIEIPAVNCTPREETVMNCVSPPPPEDCPVFPEEAPYS